MDIKQVREAVKAVKVNYGKQFHNDLMIDKNLQILLDLAESVLAVGAKMPEKKHREHNQHLTSGDWWACNYCGAMDNCGCCDVYNEAIDQCTLAFAGMIPEKDETDNDGWEDSGNMDDAYKAGSTSGWNACRDAILSAMKGGVK